MNGVRIPVGGSFITKHTNRKAMRDGEERRLKDHGNAVRQLKQRIKDSWKRILVAKMVRGRSEMGQPTV